MAELERCRSCNAAVRFLPTAKGNLMPVDADPAGQSVGLERLGNANIVVRDGRAHVLRKDEPHDGDVFVSHFATCPAAKQWSKDRLRKAADRAVAKVREGL